ncbi:hypothetical protein [Candidatus Protochlamydia phocaeensis]|uniref:hypothetical protein n=1 Tax=Candidatus Protochlamydia phocaeensis TaxID=1414722 RepID=UPI000838B1D2|nr:hypothetical protein [Candidatus Protochlamydia phocaeensis]
MPSNLKEEACRKKSLLRQETPILEQKASILLLNLFASTAFAKRILIGMSFFLFLGPLWGTEYQPWLGTYLEFEWRNSLRYQTYRYLSSHSHLTRYASDDFFLTSSLSLTAKPQFALEVEATAARTRRQSGGIDHLRVNGRYAWMDDIAGDPVTFTTGLSFIQSFVESLKDPSSFHHGRSEAELFASIGKETAQEDKWISRWWAMGGIGIAERGSPWLRFDLSYSKRLKEKHELELFACTLWGLGHKALHRTSFHGYGSIQHQSIDLGWRYTYLIDFLGSASLAYTTRIYARNFPVHTQQIVLQLLYTFGL